MLNTKVNSVRQTITPAMAKDWLENHNPYNRNLSKGVVTSYAATMKRGEWLLNGSSIDFDWDGNIINGQHRLAAVVQSGVPIECFVVTGLDPKAYTSYDCGRARTVGQLIGMQGVPNYNTVAGGISAYMRIKNGYIVGNKGLDKTHILTTNTKMVEFFEAHREAFINYALFVLELRRNVGKIAMGSSYLVGLLFYLVHDLNHTESEVTDFLSQVFSYKTSGNKSIELLRVRFLKDNLATIKMTQEYKESILAKVWNAYISGKVLKCVKWSKDDEERVPFK